MNDIEFLLRNVVSEIDHKFAKLKPRLSGLFGESLLTIAFAEALDTRGWQIEVERDYRSITESLVAPTDSLVAPAGYLNYDLLATSTDNVRCLFELKYLKPPRGWSPKDIHPRIAIGDSARLLDDIIRVAHPSENKLRRFVVVGRECSLLYPERFGKIAERAIGAGACFQISSTQSSDHDVLVPSKLLADSIARIEQPQRELPITYGCKIRKLDLEKDQKCTTVTVDIFEVCRLDEAVGAID